MKKELDISSPTIVEIVNGIKEYEKVIPREPAYNIAMFLIQKFWGNLDMMTDAVSVFLLIWNKAFYNFGIFDINSLKDCMGRHINTLQNFRERDIISFSNSDENRVKELFNAFLEA